MIQESALSSCAVGMLMSQKLWRCMKASANFLSESRVCLARALVLTAQSSLGHAWTLLYRFTVLELFWSRRTKSLVERCVTLWTVRAVAQAEPKLGP